MTDTTSAETGRGGVDGDAPVDIDIDIEAREATIAARASTDIDLGGRDGTRWGRPPLTGFWRRAQLLGRGLFSLGLLIALFIAFLLWGTGIETARHQSSLSSAFEAARSGRPALTAGPAQPVVVAETDAASPADIDDTAADDTAASGSATDEAADRAADGPAQSDGDGRQGEQGDDGPDDDGPDDDGPDDGHVPVSLAEQNLPTIRTGDAIAHLLIPAIDVDAYVVAGASRDDLKRGPGHFPETPLPGQLGNAAIAGHRATHGGPFSDIDRLEVGDDIVVETLTGEYTYRVTSEPFLVARTDAWVIGTTDVDQATLTLVSCHPRWSARERIIVQAALVPDRSAAVGVPLIGYGTGEAVLGGAVDFPTVAPDADVSAAGVSDTDAGTTGVTGALLDPGETPSSPGASTGGDDAFTGGWFADRDAFGQIAAWGAALVAIGSASFLLSRRVRNNWVGLTAGLLPFAICLYFFYENTARILPANF